MSLPGVSSLHNFARSIVDTIVRAMPTATFSNKKVVDSIKWAGKHISSPQNRLILGATALMSQPFIDLHNRKVDENTRKVSAARTVAKIIAGMTTGFLVRYYSIKAIEALCKKPGKNIKAYKSFFYPKHIEVEFAKLNHYKKAIGTYLSLAVMMFTNFMIDAPLTKFLTNKFVSQIKKKEANKGKEDIHD